MKVSDSIVIISAGDSSKKEALESMAKALGVQYKVLNFEEAEAGLYHPDLETDHVQLRFVRMANRPVSEEDDFSDLANVEDEPENLGKDFLKAQLSTKNQMKIRNVLAIISSVAVVIAFILEKLGIL